ncbi:hypothetical protein HZC27_03360 [Candidatus Roizmanbacteria bacterium]|nr:hypothetical protein [Candidatus Roizmanbacteria bacterium]
MAEPLTAAQGIQQLIVDKGSSLGSVINSQELVKLGFAENNTRFAVVAMACLTEIIFINKSEPAYKVTALPNPDIKTTYLDSVRKGGNRPTPCSDCKFGPTAMIAPTDRQKCLVIEDICKD